MIAPLKPHVQENIVLDAFLAKYPILENVVPALLKKARERFGRTSLRFELLVDPESDTEQLIAYIANAHKDRATFLADVNEFYSVSWFPVSAHVYGLFNIFPDA